MQTVTAAQMRAIDRKTTEDYGIPGLLLMENAGRGIAEIITNHFKVRNVTIFAGPGNNGGDGLVIARHLANRGLRVEVLLFADPSGLKPDPAANFNMIKRMKIAHRFIDSGHTMEGLLAVAEKSDLLVDALLGVGLEREITGVYLHAVTALNEAARNILAVDVPTGLHSDTGEILGCAVKSAVTATLGLPKCGLFRARGPEYAGRVCAVDIGIPPMAVRDVLGEQRETWGMTDDGKK